MRYPRMEVQMDFIQFITQTASPHPEAAYRAWQHQQAEIDRLRAELMEAREQNDHLRQRAYEAEARIPRLRLVG